jgi:hypothetical protein
LFFQATPRRRRREIIVIAGVFSVRLPILRLEGVTAPMKFVLPAFVIALTAATAPAQEVGSVEPLPTELVELRDGVTEPEDALEDVPGLQILDASTGIDPEDFLWEYRIVAVLAHSPRDPSFIRQMEDIRERPEVLFERDVIVLFDSDRDSDSPLRRMLRPRGFMLAIIGKDGEIKQRRPAPRDAREIGSAIDHSPLRQQEMLDRRPAGR